MKRLGFDVLVAGAGPAGLAATASATRGAAHVGLVDDNAAPGGQIWRGGVHGTASAQANALFGHVRAGGVSVLARTRVIAPLGDGALLAETPDDTLEIHYDRLILATGARERFLPFPGWTLPGVIGAGGLQALVKGGLPIAGKCVVVAGSGPLLLAAAAYLTASGARVALIAEQAPWLQVGRFALTLPGDRGKLGQAAWLGLGLRGVPFRAGCWVTRAHGTDCLQAITVRHPRGTWTHDCDYLACGFGLVPNLELPLALGCAAGPDGVSVDEWQQTSVEGVYGAGEATGIGGLDASLVEGRIAGLAATGRRDEARALFRARARTRRFAATLGRAFALRDELKTLAGDDTVVCRCEDVSYRELRSRANWRAAKLHTRCGMGPCQGRVCGAAATFLFGWTPESVRPPITAARLSSLAQYPSAPDLPQEVAP